jgi:arylsulfatase A
MRTILSLLTFVAFSIQAVDKPNFVIIFIDDMGYGDIGPFGSKINRTPHLDRMAKEGRKLTSFYVASPVCTPSRAALMTGCYPQRVGLQRGSGHIVLFPGDHHGLNPKEITIAETLKSVGYTTGCFGKWHLGDQPEFLPTAQGFDTYYGIPYSNDMWPALKRFKCPDLPVLHNTKVVELIKDMDGQATLCKKFTDAATQFIRKNKKKPFFVYLPHAFVHSPRKASPQFMAEAKTVEQAQVEEVDWSVGQILKTLREEGLEKNTLVLFTSDNGPAGGLSAGPLRGRKGTAFEGGQREPTVVWWPGTVPAGTESNELTTAMDLLPTFATLAGAKMPTNRVIDGKNITPIILGKSGAKTPHDRFFYQQGGRLAAVRSGDWKLFVKGQLYNLNNDLAEKNNIAHANPKIVKKLRGYLDDFQKDLATNSRPVGLVQNPRTLVPRPGVKGEEAYKPTLSIK